MEEKTLDTVEARFQILKYKKDASTIIEVVANASKSLPEDILRTAQKGKVRFTVLGKNLPCESKSLETRLYGKWVKNKYGTQFECSYFEMLPPSTKTGIKQFLKNLKIRGVGKVSISLIVAEFGKDTIDVCTNKHELLTKVRGISLEKAKAIHTKVIESQSYNELAIFLGQFQIAPRQIMTINKELGSDALSKICTNPYSILDAKGIGFNTADSIARGLSIMLDSEIRIKCAILSVLNRECITQGDLYVEKAKLKAETLILLNKGFKVPIVSEKLYDKVFESIATSVKPSVIIRANNLVYTSENDLLEKETAHKIIKLLSCEIPENIKERYEKELSSYRGEIKLSSKQIEAVKTSLLNPVSIITGGPGTGKTTILKAIISIYKSVNLIGSVSLLAPTGKAARRMSESTGFSANTIHSALQLYPSEENGYSFTPKDLPSGLVIIDEFSMVDQNIIHKLLNGIKGESNQLVMVGDVNQLSSVGAGDVLKEFIASGIIPTSHLSEIFRQKEGGLIIENALCINSGKTNLVYDTEQFNLIEVDNEEDGLSKAITIYLDEVKIYGIDNVMMLCPLKRQIGNRIVCVENINQKLQEMVNPKREDDISVKIGGIEYRPRDRIMQLKNAPDASNGDIGIIDEIIKDEDDGMVDYFFHITFENGNRLEYTVEDMEDVDLAYSMSIHKSQGSETKSVIIPCLKTQKSEFFSRNLLYTAVTRAKEKVTIIGDKNTINYCIANVTNGKRHTLLSKRLVVNYSKFLSNISKKQ